MARRIEMKKTILKSVSLIVLIGIIFLVGRLTAPNYDESSKEINGLFYFFACVFAGSSIISLYIMHETSTKITIEYSRLLIVLILLMVFVFIIEIYFSNKTIISSYEFGSRPLILFLTSIISSGGLCLVVKYWIVKKHSITN